MHQPMRHSIIKGAGAMMCCLMALVPAAAEPVTVWEPYEAVLHAAREPQTPLVGPAVTVSFSGPEGQRFTGRAFWDGSATYRLRTALPGPGEWRWTTACGDPTTGLDQQSGTVLVTPYDGDSPLYQHGFLKVGDDHRTLTYADGTAFFWLGDTAWAAPLKATLDDWQVYCANRTANGFTVTQICCASDWAAKADTEGHPPFDGAGLAHPNLDFWREFEAKIRAANQAGLHVMLVGLMEPVSRYPDSDEAVDFARWLTARLDGLFVSYSPSFDSPYKELGNTVGAAIREVTSRHLITQHPGTPSGKPTPIWSEQYADQPYLDFYGVQSGHNGGRLDRVMRQAREWNLAMYRHQPPKPVVNLEAMYEAGGDQAWRAEDARKAGWLSLLSGAVGYTYGAGETGRKVPGGQGGLYAWCTAPDAPDYWRKVIDWPGTTSMRHLAAFFGQLDWWTLLPAPERLLDEPDDPQAKAALATDPEAGLVVVHLPVSRGVTIDVRGLKPVPQARWYNPQTGAWSAAEGRGDDGRMMYHPEANGDWVLQIGPR